MSYSSFHKIEESLGDHWKDEVWYSMEKAGKEELSIAIQKGHFSSDGVPWITVHCDGGWSKRSYGHSYNALSGTAVVIGKETVLVLFVGVRNKYCCICTRAANLRQFPSQHRCFKNWEASSTGMETDILVEAFNNSISMHGVKYLKMIGDGDSSVYSKIRSNVSYGMEVDKIECVNHLIKNFGKSLYKIKTSATNDGVSSQARKMLTNEKIKKLQQFIMYRAKINENVEDL
nr:uncharacterized protein LOC111420407 [Onthophagus taurus]